jgi:hypothetical protein
MKCSKKLNFITNLVLNSITEFERKIENKTIFVEVGTLDDQERHLALEMPTSRMTHAKRERENTPANNIKSKPKQLKLVINSRLLACKAIGEQLYPYAKLALRVSPYFHVLAIFKSFDYQLLSN